MANVVKSVADAAGFIPMYWAQKALDVLRANIVLAQLVARDTDFAEAGWQGKTITVPYPGTFTPVDKVEGTPVTPQAPVGGTSVALNLDHHKVVPIEVEDFAGALASGRLMDRYIEPAVISLAELFETDLWTYVSGLDPAGAVGTPGTDLTAAVIRSAMVGLNTAKAPKTNRFLVLSPKDEAAVLGDSTIANYFAFSQADSIRNGYTGRLYGMDVYMSQLAPSGWRVTIAATGGTFTLTINAHTTGNIAYNATAAAVQTAIGAAHSSLLGNVTVSGPAGGPYSITFVNGVTGTLTADATNLTGGAHTATVAAAQKNAALHKNGVMFACRPFPEPPAGSGVMTAQVSDPESGLSLRISTQYDINAIATRLNIDILYGMTILRPTQGVLLDT